MWFLWFFKIFLSHPRMEDFSIFALNSVCSSWSDLVRFRTLRSRNWTTNSQPAPPFLSRLILQRTRDWVRYPETELEGGGWRQQYCWNLDSPGHFHCPLKHTHRGRWRERTRLLPIVVYADLPFRVLQGEHHWMRSRLVTRWKVRPDLAADFAQSSIAFDLVT